MSDNVTFLTFIIPTLGRPSLDTAVKSIVNQPDWNWKCIIIFDGVTPNYSIDNSHVTITQCEKKGSAGQVRNTAFPLVDTDWIAFLDDDDYIAPSYMQTLKNYTNEYPNHDLFIFTYRDVTNGNTQPPRGTVDFKYCQVGISFAVRTEFIRKHNILFQREGIEDFYFLDSCRKAGAKYLVTNSLQYFVGKRSAWQ